jgi:hypothetical protein
LAGWKRGNDGSLKCPDAEVGAFEDWRELRLGRRRACEGMASGSVLGDRGELMEGMLRSAVRGAMFWWGVLELWRSREKEEGEVGLIRRWQVGLV